MTRTQMFGIGALLLAALGVGLVMVPSQKDIGLMQFADANYAKAYDFYNGFTASGQSRSIDVVAPLLNLKIYYGEIDAAIVILKDFIQSNPRSVDAWLWLAKLYHSTQRYYLYAAALEHVQTLKPASANLRALAEMYNFLGRYHDERRILAELVRNAPEPLLEDDYRKLAIYHRVAGEREEAINAVMSGIKAKDYRVGVNTVYLAGSLYLELGKTKQAVQLVQKYLSSGRQPDSALITLTDLLKSHGQTDAAIMIFQSYLHRLNSSPALTQHYVNLLIVQGQEDAAFELLHDQFNQGKLDGLLVENLVDLALKRHDNTLALRVIDSADIALLPDDALLRYANYAYTQRDADMLQRLSSRLGSVQQDDNPLLSILLQALHVGASSTLKALRSLPDYALATPQQSIIAAGIFYRLGAYEDAFSAVHAISVDAILEGGGPLLFADLYLATQQTEQGLARLVDADNAQSVNISNLIKQAKVMIFAGLGRSDQVLSELTNLGSTNPFFVGDVYSVARRYNQFDLALAIAQYAFMTSATLDNRRQLVDALLTKHSYPQALALMLDTGLSSKIDQQLYLDVMQRWVRSVGVDAIPADDLKRFVLFVTARATTTKEPAEQRSLAYLLLELGQQRAAESLFVTLATGKPFGNPDVTELLNYWGQNLSDDAENWIMTEARRAKDNTERLGWIKYLNDLDKSELALSLFQAGEELSAPLADQYIAALLATKDRFRLKKALQADITTEVDMMRLHKLAKIASQEKFTDLAERGWRKIYLSDRRDAEATRELGLLLFSTKRYSEALGFLTQAKNISPDDYRVTMAYGEILQQQRKKREAQSYFQHAVKQVTENTEKDIWVEQDQARLLYRSKRISESIALFRNLLDKNPDDKSLRAELAGILIEQKRYQEASQLLDSR